MHQAFYCDWDGAGDTGAHQHDPTNWSTEFHQYSNYRLHMSLSLCCEDGHTEKVFGRTEMLQRRLPALEFLQSLHRPAPKGYLRDDAHGGDGKVWTSGSSRPPER